MPELRKIEGDAPAASAQLEHHTIEPHAGMAGGTRSVVNVPGEPCEFGLAENDGTVSSWSTLSPNERMTVQDVAVRFRCLGGRTRLSVSP